MQTDQASVTQVLLDFSTIVCFKIWQQKQQIVKRSVQICFDYSLFQDWSTQIYTMSSKNIPEMDWEAENVAESFKMFKQRLELYFLMKKTTKEK